MAGRESRARLLAPSFLVVATAIACGQTEDQNDIATNPPALEGGSAGASTFGGSSNPPVVGCPGTEPVAGEACSSGAGSCEYPGPKACGTLTQYTTTAACVGGKWELKQSGFVSCNPPMPVPCPSALPLPGQSCRQGFEVYPDSCSYATPDCLNIAASCVAGLWQLDSGACIPPAGEGGAGGQAGATFEPVAGAAGEPAAGTDGGAGNAP